MHSLNRRTFLTSATVAALAGYTPARAAVPTPPGSDYAVVDQAPFRGQTRRLKVTRQGRYFAALLFPTDYPTHFRLKPEWYPVCTPSGVPVTGTHEYCFIHHQSVMSGHGKVRMGDRPDLYDFYRKLPFPEPGREDRWHRDFNLFQMGPSGIQRIIEARWRIDKGIRLNLTLEWQTRAPNRETGETLLREQRIYEIHQTGPFTLIDQWTRLEPVATATATLLADRHSFGGVRVHDLIDVEDGGTMRDSEGRLNPSGNYWDAEGERRAPRWVDCSGRMGPQTAGIALMAHPSNVRNQFYVREFGLMILSPALGTDTPFSRDAPFTFAARYAAHDGELDRKIIDRVYDSFAHKRFPEW